MHTPAYHRGQKNTLFVTNVPLLVARPITRPIEESLGEIFALDPSHIWGKWPRRHWHTGIFSLVTNGPLKWSFLPFFD